MSATPFDADLDRLRQLYRRLRSTLAIVQDAERSLEALRSAWPPDSGKPVDACLQQRTRVDGELALLRRDLAAVIPARERRGRRD